MGLSPDWSEEGPADKSDSAPEGLSRREALRTWQFWTVCAINLASVFCTMLVMVHIVPFAQDIKVSATRAAFVLFIIGGVSMAGRFVCGLAIDRIGSKSVMIFSFILLTATLLWLQIAKELWMIYLFAMIYGIAHGGFYTAISPMVAEFFGIKAHGALFGIVVFSGTFGGALGPFLAGYIFDVTGGYSLAIWMNTLVSALGFVLITLLKPVNHSNKGDFNGKS
jgi:predicted MFS family arabinose efflux permease